MRLILLAISLTVLCGCKNENPPQNEEMTETPTPAENVNDLWLEEVEGEKALAWVRGQNERSLTDLTANPNYAANEAAAQQAGAGHPQLEAVSRAGRRPTEALIAATRVLDAFQWPQEDLTKKV